MQLVQVILVVPIVILVNIPEKSYWTHIRYIILNIDNETIPYSMAIYFITQLAVLIMAALPYWLYRLFIEVPIHEILHFRSGKAMGLSCEIHLKYEWRNRLYKIKTQSGTAQSNPYCRPSENTKMTLKQVVFFEGLPLAIAVFWFILYLLFRYPLLLAAASISIASSMGDILFILFGCIMKLVHINLKLEFEDYGNSIEAFIK